MASTLKHHHELTNGVGMCSVPMWSMGCPDGFCDKPAYGKQVPSPRFYSHHHQREVRMDGKYDGFVPGLACEMHAGPPPRHLGDPCKFCGTPHDDVAPGACTRNLAPVIES